MSHPKITFDEERATAYQEQVQRIRAIKDALNLVVQLCLGELPDSARLLIVGAGTGDELIALAGARPGWRFLALDPSEPMLSKARERVERAGLGGRVELHLGTLDTLPEGAPFDAATSLLVSHFLVDPVERRAFFSAIASRLGPGGLLLTADLAGTLGEPAFEAQLELWEAMMRRMGLSEEVVAERRASLGSSVALTPPEELAGLIASAGFSPPLRVYQALLMHAWMARRA